MSSRKQSPLSLAIRCWLLATCLLATPTVSVSMELTYPDLVDRLTDLERLSLLPPSGETTKQWSSWNRISRYDEATGKYSTWGGRYPDLAHAIRREGEWQVLAEMDGPGCIWRIWSARPQRGRIQIFLDGADEPVIDTPFEDLFNGTFEAFDFPALAYKTEARGYNFYIPIPYQKSCKILGQRPLGIDKKRSVEKTWGAYYHIGYTTFHAGTKVSTFRKNLSADEHAALQWSNDYFANRLSVYPRQPHPQSETLTRTVRVEASKPITVFKLKGQRAITALCVKLKDDMSFDQSAAVLRETLLRITWDNSERPSVLAPLGDFFGTVPGVNLYRSLPLGMTENGFYSYWHMPFADRAHIELVNEGPTDYELEFSVEHSPLTRPIKEYGRFHAKWHMGAFPPKEPERAIDWTMLKTEGRGRFCGVMLHIWNPIDIGWWGEGDEKFLVDGEKYPSTFGTGSEDYFGYAWGDPRLFSRPFHGQTHNPTHNRGHVSLYRWHIQDNVPFQKSFEGAIESYFGLIPEKNMQYACTAYWYLAPAQSDGYEHVPVERRTGYYDYVFPWIEKGDNHLTVERIKQIEVTGSGSAKIDLHIPQHWRWKGASRGDMLRFRLMPVKYPGRYICSMTLAKDKGNGFVQVYIDGRRAKEPIDLNAKEFAFPRRIEFGTLDLAGEPEVDFEIVKGPPDESGFVLYSIDLEWVGPTK